MVVVEFGDSIDPELVARVMQLEQSINAALARSPEGPLKGVLETVPTFRSLAVVLDPLQTSPHQVAEAVLQLAEHSGATEPTASRSWELPVCYDADFGPDLSDVARHADMDPEEVIERHQQRSVRVYLLGFLPGFAFMGDTDGRLHLPRRDEPRLRVPAGSVGLALTLTAIYPWESPGGWHLIGHSPVHLFDADRSPAVLLSPGDTVRFRRVTVAEHEHLVEQTSRQQIDVSGFLLDAPA